MKCNLRQLNPRPHRCSVRLLVELHLIIKNTGYGPAYDGNISSIPKTTAGLMKLSVAYLRAILDGTVERCNDTMKMTTKFLYYFEDCTVYSLNVTGAFADSIICP